MVRAIKAQVGAAQSPARVDEGKPPMPFSTRSTVLTIQLMVTGARDSTTILFKF
jgi:hypothetical protein